MIEGLREELSQLVWAVVIAMVGGVVFSIAKANEPEPGPFGLTDSGHWSYTVAGIAQLFWVVAFLMVLFTLVRIARILGRTGHRSQGEEGQGDGGGEPA